MTWQGGLVSALHSNLHSGDTTSAMRRKLRRLLRHTRIEFVIETGIASTVQPTLPADGTSPESRCTERPSSA